MQIRSRSDVEGPSSGMATLDARFARTDVLPGIFAGVVFGFVPTLLLAIKDLRQTNGDVGVPRCKQTVT